MNGKEPTSFRLVATLAVAGLLSGLILVAVYVGTKPTIERNQAEALRAACLRVLPGTVELVGFVARGGGIERLAADAKPAPGEQTLFAGYDEGGGLVGYAVPADGPGFMDTIKLLYGYDPRRRAIIGLEVLESRETPGLGDKIIYDERFHENFVALAVDPEIVGVKRGKKTGDNQVDTITGATISSEAVISILNRANEQWLKLLETEVAQGGGQR